MGKRNALGALQGNDVGFIFVNIGYYLQQKKNRRTIRNNDKIY